MATAIFLAIELAVVLAKDSFMLAILALKERNNWVGIT
jgi:hypothetical protein